jgi:hypothetical protein
MTAPLPTGVAFARLAFRIAGLFGIIMMTPMFFTEGMIGRRYPPPITHPEYYYGFIGIVLAWQVLFIIISLDPVRLRPAMIAAILEKLSFVIVCIVLYAQGRLVSMMRGAATVDLILGVAFFMSYRFTASRPLSVQDPTAPAASVRPAGPPRA